MNDERKAIVAYLEKRALLIENPPHHVMHPIDRSVATLFRALASDINAGLHLELEEENPDD